MIRNAIVGVIPGYREAYRLARLSRLNGEAVDTFKEMLRTSQYRELMAIDEPDMKEDIAELYLVVEDQGAIHAVMIVDPFELYWDPYVVDVIRNVTVDDSILEELRGSDRRLLEG